jgi:hypothetical protein
MASLALIVALIFLGLLIIGPTVVLLNKIAIIPKFIIWLLAIFSIFYGLWWIFIVVTPIRWIGLLPIYCGWLAIKTKDRVLDNR